MIINIRNVTNPENMHLASNYQVFQEGNKQGGKLIRKSPRLDKETKASAKKTSSLHEEYSDYSSDSISRTISNKYKFDSDSIIRCSTAITPVTE